MLDVRGHGGSGGEANLMGWYGELDVKPGIDYLLARGDVRDGAWEWSACRWAAKRPSPPPVMTLAFEPSSPTVWSAGIPARSTRPRDPRFDGLDDDASAELTTGAPHPTPLVDAVRTASPHQILVIAAGKGAMEMEADFAAAGQRFTRDR